MQTAIRHTKITETITLHYHPADREAADWIAAACEQTLSLAHQLWGFPSPERCHMEVMTSWSGFLLHAAPGPWKALLTLTFPICGPRARRM